MKIDKLRCFSAEQAVQLSILVGSGEKLIGRANTTWFHSRKALFDSKFYLLFKPGRNITEPLETYINGAFFGSKFRQSVTLRHLLGHTRLGNVLRVPLVCRMNLILPSSDGNLSEKQMARARWVKVRIELVLRFCGLKEFQRRYWLINIGFW